MKNGEKKKTIGLVLEEAHSDFSKSIIHSVVHAMMNRKDLKLIVVPGRQDVDEVTVLSEDIVENLKENYILTDLYLHCQTIDLFRMIYSEMFLRFLWLPRRIRK